jgi:hypothetical protein
MDNYTDIVQRKIWVIRSFRDETSADLFRDRNARAARRIPRDLWRVVQRKLKLLDASGRVDDLFEHPTADWTARQFRMVIAGDEPHRFLIHDHDSIYSDGFDRTVSAMGLTVLRTPVRSPQANAFCERVIGTIRRECLDWTILLNEAHLRRVQWVAHYNRGRPHASLGSGIPDSPDIAPVLSGHQIREGHRVVAAPILGGLHHEYRLEPRAA